MIRHSRMSASVSSIALLITTLAVSSASLGISSDPAFADPCAHDPCYQGVLLDPACSECAAAICVDHPDCCEIRWSLTCALAADGTCQETCPALCGDANGNRNVTATDALDALNTAIGSGSCPKFRCDFNGDDSILAFDALLILKTAVGIPADPNCPAEP